MIRSLVICHRLPDRTPSIYLFGKSRRLLCYRCCGIVVGFILPWILLLINPPFQNLIIKHPILGISIALLLVLPMVIDGLGQARGYWYSTNPRRFLTGLGGVIAQSILAMTLVTLLLRLN